MPQPVTLNKLKLNGSILRHTRSFRTNTKKDVLFIIRDWNAKEGSQETPGVQENLALEYRMKHGKA